MYIYITFLVRETIVAYKSNKYYVLLFVFMCAGVCVRVGARGHRGVMRVCA